MSPSAGAEWWRPDVAVDRGDRGEALTAAETKVTDSTVPFWALMGFTFIMLLAPQHVFPSLAPFRIALLTGSVAAAAYLYHCFTHQLPFVRWTRQMRVTACLACWAMLSAPFSYWPGGSVSFLADSYLKTLVVFWLVSHTVNTLRKLRQLAWGLCLMGIPLAVAAVEHYLSGEFLPEAGDVPRIVGYVSALSANPNDLALTLNLTVPLCVALFLTSTKPLVRLVLAGVIVLDATAIVVTFSRTGFLTLATTALLYLWKLRAKPERVWAWMAVVLAFACIPWLPSGYVGRLSTITSIESDATGSAQERWRDMEAAVVLALKHPIIGAGAGMNEIALNEERGRAWKAVHNVYLVYAVDLGVPGLVLFLLLLASCIKDALRVQQGSATVPAFRELFSLAEGIQVSLIAFAVAAVFHPVAYHFYFYYMAGLAIAANAVYEAVKPAQAQNQSTLPLRKQL